MRLRDGQGVYPRRYPEIDLALLHLGGTEVLGIMVTMDGKQGVEVMRIVNPQHAIPIHYNDYDVFKSPLSDFQREVRDAGLEDRVHYLSHGETYTFTVLTSRLLTRDGRLDQHAAAHPGQQSGRPYDPAERV